MSAIPRIQDFDDASFDPFLSDEASFGAHADPYPQLAEWLKQGPVHAMDYRAGMGIYPDMTMTGMPHYLVLGYEAVENKVHVHDWHATILHLLGLDHEKLTYRHAGREMRLTDVKGNVVKDIVV